MGHHHYWGGGISIGFTTRPVYPVYYGNAPYYGNGNSGNYIDQYQVQRWQNKTREEQAKLAYEKAHDQRMAYENGVPTTGPVNNGYTTTTTTNSQYNYRSTTTPQGSTNYAEAANEFANAIANAMHTTDAGERARLLDYAAGKAEACRRTPGGTIEFPQGLFVEVPSIERPTMRYGFNALQNRSFTTAEEAIRLTTNSMATSTNPRMGPPIPEADILAALKLTPLAPQQTTTPPVTTPPQATVSAEPREIKDSPERRAFFAEMKESVFPAMKGKSDEELIRYVKADAKKSNPSVEINDKLNSREVMLLAQRLDENHVMLAMGAPKVLSTFKTFIDKEQIERQSDGTYIDKLQPAVKVINPVAPAGPDAATNSPLIDDSPAKTTFLNEIGKFKPAFKGVTETETIQKMEVAFKPRFKDDVTRDGKLDARELALISSQLDDLGTALPASLKAARDALVAEAKAKGIYTERPVEQTGAAPVKSETPAPKEKEKTESEKTADAGPGSSSAMEIPAGNGTAAKLNKPGTHLYHTSKNQVGPLQEMMVAAGLGPVANLKKYPDGVDHAYGDKTQKVLEQMAVAAKVDLKDLDLSKPDVLKKIQDALNQAIDAHTAAYDKAHPSAQPETQQVIKQETVQQQKTAQDLQKVVVSGSMLVPESNEQRMFIQSLAAQENVVLGTDGAASYAAAVKELTPILQKKYGIDINPNGRTDGQLDASALAAVRNHIVRNPQGLSPEVQATFAVLANKQVFDVNQPELLVAPKTTALTQAQTVAAARTNFLATYAQTLGFDKSQVAGEVEKFIQSPHKENKLELGELVALDKQYDSMLQRGEPAETKDKITAIKTSLDALLLAEGIEKDKSGIYHNKNHNGEVVVPVGGAKPQGGKGQGAGGGAGF